MIPDLHVCVRMFEMHPDAHWLLDEHGVLQHANRAALRLMGNLQQVPVGVNMAQLVTDGASHCADLIHQGLRSSGATPARLRLRTSSGAEVNCRCEIALVSPASAFAPAVLWFRLFELSQGKSQFEVLNHQIEVLRREVCRRQAAEHEMARQSEWLQTVLLGIAEGVVATDLMGYVLFMNQVAAELTGWPRALSMGRPATEIVQLLPESESDTRANLGVVAQQYAGADFGRSRMRLVARDGGVCMVEASFFPLTSESGVLSGSIVVFRSVESEVRAERERLALEHQLRASQKMEALGTMAGGVAHDFNNIVAAILGNVELALEDTPPESEGTVSLLEIRKAGRRARDLVQQILTFSRRQDNTRAAISIRTLLHEAQSLLRTALPSKVELVVESEGQLPTVWANETQIQQVLLNLMGNALQAFQGRPSGKVNVHVSRLEGPLQPADAHEIEVIPEGMEWPGIGVCIRVSDNGIGMTPLVLSRIFEPFFTTKSTGSGTGLGLAVVHGILHEHNAVLRVRSAPGEGTLFTVVLPAMTTTDPLDEPVADDTAAIQNFTPKMGRVPHVLYVDDDESMAFLVQRFLVRNGYQVTTCSCPVDALTCLQSGKVEFTLCITDYNMPLMCGLTLATEIKERWPDLAVAIASGYITEELREQAPLAGVVELIYKPNTVEELCCSIERLIERDSASFKQAWVS